MSWFYLIFIATILSSLTSLLDKFFCEKKFKNVATYLILGNFLQLPYFLILLFKADYQNSIGWPLVLTLLSGPIFLLMWLVYLKSLKTVEVSRAVAVYNVNIIFVTMAAIFFLGEKLSFLKILAIFLIFIGASLCSYEKTNRSEKLNSGYLLVILSALIGTIGNLFSKIAVEKINPLTVYLLSYFISWPIFLAFLSKKSIREEFIDSLKNKKIAGTVFINRTISFLTVCLYYLAISKGPISLITAILGSSPMLVFIFSTFLSFFFPKIIKEKISKEIIFLKAVAIVLIVSGVVIINF